MLKNKRDLNEEQNRSIDDQLTGEAIFDAAYHVDCLVCADYGARFDVPDFDGVVAGTGNEIGAVWIDVAIVDGALAVNKWSSMNLNLMTILFYFLARP